MNDQNPYDQDGGYDDLAGPERTSALAVTSLVMSLICCIPGLGLLGAGLGVGALMGIGGSRGRVGGKGLATAGIIIGLLMTVAWISFASLVWSGVKEVVREVYTPMHEMMTDIEAGDWDSARSTFPGAPIAMVTDEQFEAFRSTYQAEIGSFASIPTDPGGLFEAYAQVGQQMQGFQQPGGQIVLIPVPATFDGSGPVVMIVTMQVAQAGSGPPPSDTPITNISVRLPSGGELKLLSQGALPASPLPPGSIEVEEDEPADPDGP